MQSSEQFDEICMISTGILTSVNSNRPNTHHYYTRSVINPSYQLYFHYNIQPPISQFVDIPIGNGNVIGIGDEVFDDYGGTWFEDRGIIESNEVYSIEKHRYTDMAELEELGICLSNVVIGRSSIITSSISYNGEKPLLVDASSPPQIEFSMDGEAGDASMISTAVKDHSEVVTTHKNTDQGTGLFAKKAFKKGELIIVSPVLMIPLHDAIETTKEPLEGYNGTKVTSILMNYLFVSSGRMNHILGDIYVDLGIKNPDEEALYSDISLFAMGSGASANHRPSSKRVSSDGETANMEIEWFAFDTKDHKSKSRYLNNDNYLNCQVDVNLDGGCGDEYIHYDESKQEPDTILYDRLYKTDPNVVESHPFAPLDIAYRANRDIEKGAELFIDYGVEWENAFDIYLLEMDMYESRRKEVSLSLEQLESFVTNEKPPQFRCPLVFPTDLFPNWWIGVSCIGVNCVSSLVDEL